MVPDTISDEVAVSFPIAAMTPYHALKEAGARAGQTLMVYGAAGNTGIFAIQLANMMGLNVFAVSSKAYLDEYGARETFPAEKIPEDFKADIVINPLGGEFFSKSLTHVQRRGKLITFGVLNGRDTTIDIGRIYTNEISSIGSTGQIAVDSGADILVSASYIYGGDIGKNISYLKNLVRTKI